MSAHRRPPPIRYAACLSLLLALAFPPAALAAAAELRATYAKLLPRLENNAFQRPLHLHSRDVSGKVHGDVHARLDHPYAMVAAMLARPATWCDILFLHPNTKYCHATPAGDGAAMTLYKGRKFDQPLEDAHRVDLVLRVAAATADYLDVRLDAERGPLGTHDYHIGLKAVPLDDGRTFLHLSYTYAYGLTGRLAKQGYFATLGRGKVGFTVTGKGADGQPQYVGGTLGAAERNAMRYFLAIEAYLDTLGAPAAERLDRRLRAWFAATERHPRQLYELQLNDYLAMKRREYARQQSSPPPAE